MTPSLRLHHRLLYFISFGVTAALIHLGIVFQLVSHVHLHPLIANIVGFLTAFNISYLGHKYFTFSQLEDKKQLSFPHFFIVAASAGTLNESLYFLVLRFTSLNYLFALVLVLGLVSIYNYITSRFWACR